jgi:hypothetical protein
MGLPNLFYPPEGDAGWREYWYMHFQDHLEILQAIQKLQNVKLTEYIIYPWDLSDKDGILERHQQYHNDLNGSLYLNGSDLSELDFNNQNEVKAWIQLNFYDHQNARAKLGI